jgi:hypothetical protein
MRENHLHQNQFMGKTTFEREGTQGLNLGTYKYLRQVESLGCLGIKIDSIDLNGNGAPCSIYLSLPLEKTV